MQNNSPNLTMYGTEFSKAALEILNKIDNSKISERHYQDCLEELQYLILSYLDYLPRHFVELLDMFEQLTTLSSLEDIFSIQGHAILSRAKRLCELMCEPPSLELYINLALDEFECLYQYSDFSEETISSVINYLLHGNNPAILSIETISTFEKFNFTDKKKSLLWLSLSKVPTTKALQLRAIENINLTGKHFSDFCREMAISTNCDEELLCALVKKVNETKISNTPKIDNEQKAIIYYYITLCAAPPISVVKEIIEVIHLSDDNYFNFFYMIIQEFAKRTEPANKSLLLSTILKKINSDEPSKTEEVKIGIRRLRLLANNL